MEISKEELQMWIREKIKKNTLISRDVLEKYNLLQSLLEGREKRAAHLLKLCESVAACEAIVKKQYSFLGWKYRDTDSDDDDDDDDAHDDNNDDDDYHDDDDDDNQTGFGNTPPPPCEVFEAETQVPCSSTTNGRTCLSPKLQDILKRQPVVVMTRLPPCMISSLRPPRPQNNYSEDESVINSDTDVQWKPEDDSSDSDSNSSYNTGPKKRRKLDHKNEKPPKSPSKPQTDTNGNAESNASQTLTPPANTNGVTPECIVKSLCQSTDKATKTHPGEPQGEIRVNMNVLARRKKMNWQQGEIMEIFKREDGSLKYKISFGDKRRILVSGHHIAFDCMPKVEQLFVGARVVVKCQADKPQFCPGILAELPTRKNRMRFLVLMDDHTPVYVGLPLLYLVCSPLSDPLDDIPDGTHKDFMKQYMKFWPYPPQSQYRVGQIINTVFNGVQHRCEVLVVDCSLIQIVFQKDQHKEWIYRGSLRLEHVIKIMGHMELKMGQKK